MCILLCFFSVLNMQKCSNLQITKKMMLTTIDPFLFYHLLLKCFNISISHQCKHVQSTPLHCCYCLLLLPPDNTLYRIYTFTDILVKTKTTIFSARWHAHTLINKEHSDPFRSYKKSIRNHTNPTTSNICSAWEGKTTHDGFGT